MPVTIGTFTFDDSSDRTLVGVSTFDRTNGGTLVFPSGTSFPVTPVAGETFWREDEAKLYRRNNANTAWDAAGSAVAPHAATHVTGGTDVIANAVPAGNAGLMTGADKTKLDGIATSATNTPLTVTAPVDVTRAAATAGVSTSAARADHKHDITVAAPSTIGTANAAGSASSLAASDHVHDHGAQTAGTLHAAVIAAGANGFMTGADKTKLDGVATGATNTPLTAAAPANITKAAAAVGVATDAARADHKHDITTAAPSTIGTANTEGASTSLARADHTHDHGAQTVGTLHAAVIAAGASGFMTGADKTKLDGITTGATNTPLASTAPADVTRAAAAVGVGTTAARADHKHDISVAAPVTIGTANAAGSASSLAASDHVHSHGNQAGGALHADVIAAGASGFMSGADKTKLDGVAVGATNLALAAVAPADVTKAAAAVGVGTTAARVDHKHDISTAAPSTIGTANAEGTATSLARSDHTHNHGNQAGGALHADVIAAGASGFMSGADKTKLDGVEAGAQVTSFARVQTALNAASGTVGFNNQLLSNVLAPVAGTDAANKAYVDALITSKDVKDSCRVATTANITLSGPQTIDGVAAIAGDRVLVKNQATGSQNGIYVVAAGAWARSTDADTSAEVTSGMMTTVSEGTANADTGWLLTTNDPIVLGTTSLAFVLAWAAGGVSLAVTAPADVTKAAAAVGVGTTAARADHKHDITTAAAVTLATANTEGTATTLARSDHTHDHGAQTVGTLHAAVIAAGASGFMTGADKTKLDGIATGATNLALASTAPADTTKAAAAVGVGTTAARADHKHDITTAAAVTLSTANAEGTATTLARSDHTHDHGAQTVGTLHAAVIAAGASGFMTGADKTKLDGVATGATNTPLASVAPVNVTKAAAAVGVATDAARADHKHDISTAAAVTLATANAEGVATTLARSDHTHDHGAQTVGTLHAAVIAAGASGFMTGADKTKLDGIAASAAALTAAAPADVTKAAAAVGVATLAARADHKHDITTAAPATGIGAANSEGTATSLARSDHNHTLRESGGTGLTMGAIADGEFLKRVGTAVVGAASAGASTLLQTGFINVVANTTTTSTSFVTLLTLTPTVTAGSRLVIRACGAISNTANSVNMRCRITVDGVSVGGVQFRTPATGVATAFSLEFRTAALTAGAHTINLEWATASNTMQCRPVANPDAESASLSIMEVTV